MRAFATRNVLKRVGDLMRSDCDSLCLATWKTMTRMVAAARYATIWVTHTSARVLGAAALYWYIFNQII